MLKVYERIMKKRVREILDKQLEESQSDFGKGRSCQDHTFTPKRNFGKNTCRPKNLDWFRRHTKSL